jgi:hypothetical protein
MDSVKMAIACYLEEAGKRNHFYDAVAVGNGF